jgi:cell division protein FtsL
MQGRPIDALEFTVSPTIHNQPIRLQVDPGRQREFRRWTVVGAVVLAAAVFNGWQRSGTVEHSAMMLKIQREIEAEDAKARQLKLNRASLRSPARIEALATQTLHLVRPGRNDAVVIELFVPAPQPPASVVASR